MEQDATNKLGKHIRRLREQRGLSLRRFAAISGIHSGSLSNIENGSRTPELATLKAIATALGVPVTEMVAIGDYLNPYDLLPSATGSLHTRYGHLSKEAFASIDTYLKRLIDEHGFDANGPLGREDETSESVER